MLDSRTFFCSEQRLQTWTKRRLFWVFIQRFFSSSVTCKYLRRPSTGPIEHLSQRFTLACVDHHTLNERSGWRKDFLGLSGVIKTTWRSLTGIVFPGTKKQFFLDSLLLCPNWPFRVLSRVAVHLSDPFGRERYDVTIWSSVMSGFYIFCLSDQ